MASPRQPLRIEASQLDTAALLVAEGVLDSSTYRQLRDTVVKAALAEPAMVIVDVSGLDVPTPSAWSVFTSARWHVCTWPDVPILLVRSDPVGRQTLVTNGVARYLPVHPTRESALVSAPEAAPSVRRRACARLPANKSSIPLARSRAGDWLMAWTKSDFIPVAGTVATVFVENALAHTDSAPTLIVESKGDTVTVAVEDASTLMACRHEDRDYGVMAVSGLAIVAAVARVWGSSPTPNGKTVWAVLGPENVL